MTQIGLYTGKCIGLTTSELCTLRDASLLHDIGKVKIPKNVLLKKESLSSDDWSTIKEHPGIGFRLMKRKHAQKEILAGILSHHERWSGNGYPNGLKGENIPLLGRIIAVADALDAMVSSRPYRYFPLSADEALSELDIHAGTQFDPYIAKNLLCQEREVLCAALLGFRSRCLG